MDSKGKRSARGAAAAGGDKPRWKTAGKKGPSDGTAPPKGKGKPSSKKNKARRAESDGGAKGGNFAPKRKG